MLTALLRLSVKQLRRIAVSKFQFVYLLLTFGVYLIWYPIKKLLHRRKTVIFLLSLAYTVGVCLGGEAMKDMTYADVDELIFAGEESRPSDR